LNHNTAILRLSDMTKTLYYGPITNLAISCTESGLTKLYNMV